MDSRKKIAEQNKKKMNTDMKIFLSIASVVIIGLVILLIVILSPKDETMAIANGEDIKQSEFEYYYTQDLASILQYKDPSVDQETFLNSTYGTGTGTIKSMLKQQAMSQVIQTRYLLSEAKKEGFDFDNKDINDRWQSFRSELEQNAQQSKMGIEEFSKSYIGSGTGRIEQIFKDQAKAQVYYYATAEQVAVDETKLAEFYDNNKAGIDLAGVRHILVGCVETASDATVAEKKKLAEEILQKVVKGDDFTALALQYSEDPGSKDNGGFYEISKGQMVKEFEDWAFMHKAGDTGIVKTEFGFHVMKLDYIKDTLESQRDDIIYQYRISSFQDSLNAVTESDEFEVVLKDPYNSF